ncbi:amino acid ABC transporter permease [Methanogenium marinum]|uniref:Amino acid ABC transporter permease n=1 Tax=Methanogenium marinum TaxID=348610 RepID=A0A9Q4KWI3_9EURY|nr:amino acid ABC transporter permease [Methanogenium marinum]MDE4909081.1 amino acid ABC transporter permease [Methanogenium marinum]
MDQAEFLFQILLPVLMEGMIVTIKLIVFTAPFGLILGILVAVGRVYGSKPISLLCKGAVGFIKGTPLLLMLFILYFGLPSIGITLSAFVASLVGFIMCNGAYNSEYIRGAISSIKEGQIIAAQALGMTRMQAVRHIILPQALIRAIPGLSNEFIYLIKYSSLAYMLTVIELTGAGKMVATKYFEFTEVFMIVGIGYLILVTITTIAVMLIERKVAVPGMTQSGRNMLDIL